MMDLEKRFFLEITDEQIASVDAATDIVRQRLRDILNREYRADYDFNRRVTRITWFSTDKEAIRINQEVFDLFNKKGKKKDAVKIKPLLVKDLINDLERSENTKKRIQEQLSKNIDTPKRFEGPQYETQFPSSVYISSFPEFPKTRRPIGTWSSVFPRSSS